MIDVDCFKPYNDTYGHLLGDDILKAVAKNLQQEVKGQNGFLARYGGEEFIIIFEDKSYDEVIAIANKLNQLVVDMKIEHKASSVDDFITISVGVAQSYYREDYERERLIQYADDALYAAKQSGKNTIFFNTKHGIEKVKT
jgi:two-component system chemotaxis family response regulator WspR